MSTVFAAFEDLRDRCLDLWDAIRAVAADDLRRLAGWIHRRADRLEVLAEHGTDPMAEARRRWRDLYWRSVRVGFEA